MPGPRLHIHTLAEIGEDSWNSFASMCGGGVFHHASWHALLERTYGIRPLYAALTGGDGAIEAAMPLAEVKGLLGGRRLVSYPFSDACGPIARNERVLRELLEKLPPAAEGYDSIEVRMRDGSLPAGYSADPKYVSFELQLGGGTEHIWRAFHKDCVQRQIKKAFRSGLEVFEGEGRAGLKDFYGLHLATRKRLGAPVQPFSFFKNLFDALCPSGMASLLVVRRRGRALAAVLLLKHGKTAYYKFGASAREAGSLGANQLALWTAIRKSSDEGYQTFDLGRTYSGNPGLMEYKARWGASAVPLAYLNYPGRCRRMAAEGGRAGKVAGKIIRKLPVVSNRLLGKLLYRYLA